APSTSLLGLGLALEPLPRPQLGTSIFDEPPGNNNPDTRIDSSPAAESRVGLGPIRSSGIGAPAGFGGGAAAGPGRH
ncbi:MAG: hypothetical protein ACRESY_05310, partial [Steroidobacteraceae bacterium]